ncbi:type II secretion system F family protein [Pseudomonas chlororaphis]|uniref:type II secretion system F family protein n=1 Tax=Pseudomonas chlororaphis TaxID=587753 RepID=UPI00209B24A0|nr:type II secretion system F family protein [Pseudomonas chlororaphis]MCO7570838.1 type II secretion system F family protein [Pseudomonas chlororaphis]MCO7588642.1 type II secretion system F family protein [Pseudomonas chlororaphis]
MAVKAPTTSVYLWHGIDGQGQVMRGELSAANPALIRAQLRKQGITPTWVRRKPRAWSRLGQRIRAREIALFTRQLATLMQAGVPLLQSFDIIAESFEQPLMRQLLASLKREIEGGASLATALRRHPRHFDALYCNLVDAGEQAGALDTLLERVATHKEKSENLKARIQHAMVYPLAVIGVAVIVSSILLLKVVPQFQSLFAGFDAELPPLTQWVINLSHLLQRHGGLLLAASLLVGIGLIQAYRRSARLRDKVDVGLLRMPLAGPLLQKSAVARYARTLATTFAAGVPLVQALDSVAGTSGNQVFKHAVERIRQQVASGMQLHFAMRASGVFPGMAVQMTAIGEESGTLEHLLEKVATHYESEVDHLVDSLTRLMEPLIMVLLGSIVGALVVAMYLPVFQLGTAI